MDTPMTALCMACGATLEVTVSGMWCGSITCERHGRTVAHAAEGNAAQRLLNHWTPEAAAGIARERAEMSFTNQDFWARVATMLDREMAARARAAARHTEAELDAAADRERRLFDAVSRAVDAVREGR